MLTTEDLVIQLRKNSFNARIVSKYIVQVKCEFGYINNVTIQDYYGIEQWGCSLRVVENCLRKYT